MGFGEIWAQFNGKLRNLNMSADNSGQGAFDKNAKIKLIFDYFDINNNGNLDKDEISTFIHAIKATVNKDGLSIFSQSEQEEFIETRNSEGKSLKDLNIQTQDLMDFVNVIYNAFGEGVNNIPTEYIETMEFLNSIVNNASQTMEEHETNTGVISKTVRAWNEIFHDEYSHSTTQYNLDKTENDIQNLLNATRLGRFETEFEKNRGVKYSKENVNKCREQAEIYTNIQTAYDMISHVKQELAVTTNGTVGAHMRPHEASAAIVKALQLCGIVNPNKMNDIIKKLEEKLKNNPEFIKYGGNLSLQQDKNGNFVINRTVKAGGREPATQEQLKLIAIELNKMMDKTLLHALGEDYSENMSAEQLSKRTEEAIEKQKKKYEESFTTAFGGEDAALLAQKYVEKEQHGVQNVEMGLNILNMAIMFIPGGAAPGWLTKIVSAKNAEEAIALAKATSTVTKAQKVIGAGKTIAAVSSIINPADIVEKLTSGDGMSEEEFVSWWNSCKNNLKFMAAGAVTGKAVYSLIKSQLSKGLIETLKNSGKTSAEILDSIIKEAGKIDKLSNALGIPYEAAAGIATAYAINKDISNYDIVACIATSIAGGVLSQQLITMKPQAKVKHLQNALKDFNISEKDVNSIIAEIDKINNSKQFKSANKNKSSQTRIAEPTEASLKKKEELELKLSKQLQEQGYLRENETIVLHYDSEGNLDLTRGTLPNGEEVSLVIENGFGIFSKQKPIEIPSGSSKDCKITVYDPKGNYIIKCSKDELQTTIQKLQQEGKTPTSYTINGERHEIHKNAATESAKTSEPKSTATNNNPPEPEYYVLPGDNPQSSVPKSSVTYTPQTLTPELKAYFNRNVKAAERFYPKQTAALSENVGKSLTKVTSLPDNFDLNTINTQIENGGVCTIGDKLYVNDNGQAVELKMTRQTFERLFPENGFSMIEQTSATNLCTLLSRLNAMSSTPTGRAKLYQMIEQNGTDIVVHLGRGEPITFKGGSPIKLDDSYRIGNGASEGVELIEQAVLCNYANVNPSTDGNIKFELQNATNLMGNNTSSSYYQHDLYLFGENRNSVKIRRMDEGYEANIKEFLENFNPDNTVVEAIWEMHARNITGYNPNNKTVVIHDPYFAGVDITYTIDEFISLCHDITYHTIQ